MPEQNGEPGGTRVRRTQEERSAAMRARLLDATIDSLIDLGYSATTTTVIADRAGVLCGAQLHHFPTKAELVAAAVEHLAMRIGTLLQQDGKRLKARGLKGEDVIDALWARYQSPLFSAWLELSVAARTDSDLAAALVPVEKRLRTNMSEWANNIFGDHIRQGGGDIWALTFYVLQGLALDRTVFTESARRRTERETQAIEAWKEIVAERLASRKRRSTAAS